MTLAGKLITIEGIDGSGKSTLITGLKTHLESLGHTVLVTRDPGGTDVGQAIRQIVLHHKGFVDPLCELLLYIADRAQHVAEKITPALAQGYVVLCDRYTDSTLAYQGYGRELSITTITELNALATRHTPPYKTLLLDGPVETLLMRARKQTQEQTQQSDRLEAESVAFYERVRHGFLTLAQQSPERFISLNATDTPEQILAAAIAALS